MICDSGLLGSLSGIVVCHAFVRLLFASLVFALRCFCLVRLGLICIMFVVCWL